MYVVQATLFPIADLLVSSGRVDAALVPHLQEDDRVWTFIVCADLFHLRLIQQLGLDVILFPTEDEELFVLHAKHSIDEIWRMMFFSQLTDMTWLPSGDDMWVAAVGSGLRSA